MTDHAHLPVLHWTSARGDWIVNLATGEALALHTADTDELAQTRAAFSELRTRIDDANRVIDAEIARRLDHENTRSTRVYGWGVEVNAPRKPEWDVPRLHAALRELSDAGRISDAVAAQALRPPPIKDWKPALRELKLLLEHDDQHVRDTIRECREMVPQRRSVKITPPAAAPVPRQPTQLPEGSHPDD